MRAGRLYPFLLAAAPVLHVVAENPGVSSDGDAALIVLVTLALVAATYLLAALAQAERFLTLTGALLVAFAVTRIVQGSALPPVIVIQGDHGTKTLGFNEWAAPEQVPAAAAQERFGAFGAYYLPGGGEAAFGDTVTVVNVLGNVLRHYFGADLPREPDAQYLSLHHAPFDVRPVSAAWLATGRIPRQLVRSRPAGGAR